MKVVKGLVVVLFGLTFPLLESYAQAPLTLSLSDTIDRALRYNLAVATATQEERVQAAQRLKALYELYPRVDAVFTSTQQQINLAAFGFTGFSGVPPIIGPFALVDARTRLTQPVWDRKLVHDLREAKENERAASFANDNTRELVVLTAANFYLQALAASSRAAAAAAQVARAEVLYKRAGDLKNSGLVPAIDVLRAQVELQTQQQRLLAFRNDLALQKLNLVRAIGVPLDQEITLTDHMPANTPAITTLSESLQTARENRSDLRRAESLVKAAQHALDAARAETLPTVGFDADYGAIGPSPGRSHGTYLMRGELKIPVFNKEDAKSDRIEAEARLEQRRLETNDLKAAVEMEVRAAFIEITSAQEQVRVAESSLDLARQQLDQAQDRFEAGVTGNLEVVQAQEALALADENVIIGLYSLNVSKARLARSMGTAEKTIKTFLGGRP